MAPFLIVVLWATAATAAVASASSTERMATAAFVSPMLTRPRPAGQSRGMSDITSFSLPVATITRSRPSVLNVVNNDDDTITSTPAVKKARKKAAKATTTASAKKTTSKKSVKAAVSVAPAPPPAVQPDLPAMKKNELVEEVSKALSEKLQLTKRKDAEIAIQTVLSVIRDQLNSGEYGKVSWNGFGTFSVKYRNGRVVSCIPGLCILVLFCSH
jgi:nucleoid DNA-binding protein